MNNETKTHPFQITLGLGPYRYAGFFALILPSEANQGRNNFHLAPKVERGMGTCAHCGHGITNVYIVSIGDGKLFGVGSECIEKASLPHVEMSKVQKVQRELARNQRAERKAKKGLKARQTLESIILEQGLIMANLPHPKMDRGSLLDYANWIVKHSSDGGIVFALKLIENNIKVLAK